MWSQKRQRLDKITKMAVVKQVLAQESAAAEVGEPSEDEPVCTERNRVNLHTIVCVK